MKWWDDYAVPVFGLIGFIGVFLFGVFGIFSVFFGVSKLSGFYMGFGIIGVAGGCILIGMLVSYLVGLAPYAELADVDEDDEDDEEEEPAFVERRSNRARRVQNGPSAREES